MGHTCRIFRSWVLYLSCLIAIPVGLYSRACVGQGKWQFTEVAEQVGLLPAAGGLRGHGAAWGDFNQDGWLDLYVATFATGGGETNRLFFNRDGRFEWQPQPAVQVATRATGVVAADLDNDGDLDLYVASMPAPPGSRLAEREGRPLRGCCLFRNDGGGRFTDVSEGNGACPEAFGGRSVAVLDFDGDGLLDLFVGEDPHPGYNGSSTRRSRLFRNRGDLAFEDVTAAGLPDQLPGLGVAAGDVNNDGWPDLFAASSDGGNRLFLNDGRGRFIEASWLNRVFEWPDARGDNMVCGVALADVNRDGWLDLVLGQHYDHPWRVPVPNRLYLNRTHTQQRVSFEDVTEAAGLEPLAMKAPHVEIQDFDNDGWPEIYQSVVKFAEGKCYPILFRHTGLVDGLPRFSNDAWQVNSFPDASYQNLSSRDLFDRLVKEKIIFYSAPGPVADWNRDGKLDIFLASWWPELPPLLLKNETPGGNWLQVSLEGSGSINRMGIGSRILVYRAGGADNPSELLGCREIAVGYGYASGQPAAAHFGLGTEQQVDLVVVLPHGRGRVVRRGVAAGQHIVIRTAP